jgi:hypothetical protein
VESLKAKSIGAKAGRERETGDARWTKREPELALSRFLSHTDVYDNNTDDPAAKPPGAGIEGEGSIGEDEPERYFA